MKRCELCKAKARVHCASDQASLCWDCDAAIHSANFLVARHSRNLLCEVCQSPTPWSASGCKLRPTSSICKQCVDEERYDDSGEEESDAASEEEVLEDNQVVLWSPASADESVDNLDVVVSRKRLRTEADQSCTTSRVNIRTARQFTRSKTEVGNMDLGRVDICGSVILDSLRRLHQEDLGLGLGLGLGQDQAQAQQIVEFCDSPGPPL